MNWLLVGLGALLVIAAIIFFGLGFAVGSSSRHMDNSWRWGLRDDRDDFEESSKKKTE